MYGICTDYRISRAIGKNPQNYRFFPKIYMLIGTKRLTLVSIHTQVMWSDDVATLHILSTRRYRYFRAFSGLAAIANRRIF